MILQQFSDAEYQAHLAENGGDWRRSLGQMLVEWCDAQPQDRVLVSFRKWGFIPITIRVRHLRALAEIIAGPLT